MTTTDPSPAIAAPEGLLDPNVRLTWPMLVPAVVLIAIYTMLSYIGFFDQASFYDSMDIPVPSNEFLLYSWAGKNTAVLLGLVIATVTRLRVLVLTAIAMLVTMQMGDVNAGAQSGVNVFVTWIAFALTVAQLAIVVIGARRTA
ncbi:MAG: hypothetical protein AAGA90_08330 [Actinomycetota bacterium]